MIKNSDTPIATACDLAIVIPAYKARFLRQTLNSISTQRSKQFTAYVGGDAPPDDIHSIVKEFESDFDIKHIRFENNLGGTDLVSHWHRCIAQTHETWVWLFSDDDTMEACCTAEFFNYLALWGKTLTCSSSPSKKSMRQGKWSDRHARMQIKFQPKNMFAFD